LGHSTNNDHDPYAHHSDFWFTIQEGVNVLELTKYDLQERKGLLNFNEPINVSFGGGIGNGAEIRFGWTLGNLKNNGK
jgi:hypothetical protein